MVQEDDPSSVKTELLGGRTQKCCWEVQDEGAGERLKNFGSKQAFWNWGTKAVSVTFKDNICCGMHGLCGYFQQQVSLFKKHTVGKKINKRKYFFTLCKKTRGNSNVSMH